MHGSEMSTTPISFRNGDGPERAGVPVKRSSDVETVACSVSEMDIGRTGGGSLGTALVAEIGAGGEILLTIDGGLRQAQRAYSCVIEPVPGDRVVTALLGDAIYVLAILDRLAPEEAVLSAPGGHCLTLAAEDIALRATGNLRLSASSLSLRAHAVSLVGRLVTFVADHLRTTGRQHEVVADQIATQARTRVTVVRETDVLDAGTVSQSVAGVTSTTAATAVLVAKEDVRFDGKRVTVG